MKTAYSQPMIKLVIEIRRRIESDLKPGIKLANPYLLVELIEYFPTCKDVVLKALIKELMEIAGEDWQEQLAAPVPRQIKKPEPTIVKAYRGSVSVESAPVSNTTQIKKNPAQTSNSSKMVYRGCVVNR